MLEFITTRNAEGVMFCGARAFENGNDTVIIDIHGISWDFYTTSFYRHFYNNISAQGVDFIAGETRAAFKMKLYSSTTGYYYYAGGAFETFEDCISDIKSWIDKAEEFGYKKIILSGYSLGPAKAAYYYSQTKDARISKIIFYSPSDMYGLTHEPNELARHERLLAEAKQLVAEDKGREFLSEKLWDAEILSANTYLSLFDNPNVRVFNYFDTSLGNEIVSQIDIPVLAITGTKDEGIVVTSKPAEVAMDILKNNMTNCPALTIKILDGADHSFDGFEEDLLRESVQFAKSIS